MNKTKEEKKKEFHKNWVALTARFIPYNPILRKLTGSVTSAILMQQLEYWFSVMGGPFYKYMTMPEGEYTRGNRNSNWADELEFSEDEFRTAFDKIGIRYRSKKAFNEAPDKFQGKMYLSYYEKTSHLTYYRRNQPLIESNLMTLEISTSKGNEKNQSNNTDNSNVDNKQENTTETNKENIPHTSSLSAGKGESDISSYKEIDITGNGNSDKSSLNVSLSDDDALEDVEAVFNYYYEVFGKKVSQITLTPLRIKKTKKFLEHFSVFDFQLVIDMAWASDFYRGEEEEYELRRRAGILTFDQLINSYEQFENMLNQANYEKMNK